MPGGRSPRAAAALAAGAALLGCGSDARDAPRPQVLGPGAPVVTDPLPRGRAVLAPEPGDVARLTGVLGLRPAISLGNAFAASGPAGDLVVQAAPGGRWELKPQVAPTPPAGPPQQVAASVDVRRLATATGLSYSEASPPLTAGSPSEIALELNGTLVAGARLTVVVDAAGAVVAASGPLLRLGGAQAQVPTPTGEQVSGLLRTGKWFSCRPEPACAPPVRPAAVASGLALDVERAQVRPALLVLLESGGEVVLAAG